MPQGGIDAGEDPATAALRELKEEIGTDKAEIIAESADWYAYDLPPHLVGQVWRGKYRGQRQKWFVMRFSGQDSDIDLEAHEPEFRSWQWMAMTDLVAQIVPFKRDVYTRLATEFNHLFKAP